MLIHLITLNSLVVQRKGNVVSDMEGSKVMLSIDKGKYYNFGEIGGEIWDLIETPIKIENAVARLMEQYDVEKEVCEVQVLSFIEQLSKEDLVKVKVD